MALRKLKRPTALRHGRRKSKEPLPTPCGKCARMELNCCHMLYSIPANVACSGFVATTDTQRAKKPNLKVAVYTNKH